MHSRNTSSCSSGSSVGEVRELTADEGRFGGLSARVKEGTDPPGMPSKRSPCGRRGLVRPRRTGLCSPHTSHLLRGEESVPGPESRLGAATFGEPTGDCRPGVGAGAEHALMRTRSRTGLCDGDEWLFGGLEVTILLHSSSKSQHSFHCYV